jgi:hypothetical protein
LVQRLLGFALDGEAPDAVALTAIRDALDRAGLGAKTALELSVAEPKPWEEVLQGLAGIATITREEFRAQRGLPADTTPALESSSAMEVVDAELVPAQEPDTWAAQEPTDGLNPPDSPGLPRRYPGKR